MDSQEALLIIQYKKVEASSVLQLYLSREYLEKLHTLHQFLSSTLLN